MHDLQRLRFVTKRYRHLQGLRLVPVALPFLVSAAWRDGAFAWVPGTHGIGAGYWFGGMMSAAVAISVTLGRYYTQSFGSVAHAWNGARLLKMLSFVVMLGLAVWTQSYFSPTVSFPTIAIGITLGYIGVSGGHTRTHYLALAALCVAFATLGWFGVPLHVRDVLLDDLIGIGLIVIGIGDHIVLRQTLAPVSHVETV